MALVQCPACEKDISPNAMTCPGCGEPMREQPQTPERVEVITRKELENERSFNAWAYMITWFLLVVMFYKLDLAIFAYFLGEGAEIPEVLKWVNAAVLFTVPTAIVYFLRKIIPFVFAITIIGIILLILFTALGNAGR